MNNPQQRTVRVTTSWDDGHVLDVKLAALLERYGLVGTFYITPECREIPKEKRLTAAQVQRIATKHEIGAHTLTHPRLPLLTPDEQRREISEGRRATEKLCKKPVTLFCYTHGEYTEETVRIVKDLGFKGARTIHWFREDVPRNKFLMGATLHASYFTHWKLALICLKENPRLVPCLLSGQWEEQAKQLFDSIAKRGGVFHLWGHSEEIDRHGDWEALERVCKHIASAPQRLGITVQAIPNGALIEDAK